MGPFCVTQPNPTHGQLCASPCRRGDIKRCRDPSVRLSVRLSAHLGQLVAQRLGQATGAVRTADPSARGRRSAAIGGRGAYRLAARDNLFGLLR